MATYKYTTFANFPKTTKDISNSDLQFIGYDEEENKEVLIDAGLQVNSAINLMYDAYTSVTSLTADVEDQVNDLMYTTYTSVTSLTADVEDQVNDLINGELNITTSNVKIDGNENETLSDYITTDNDNNLTIGKSNGNVNIAGKLVLNNQSIDDLKQDTTIPNNIITGTTIGYLDEGTDISGWSVTSVLTAILCKVTPDIIMPTCRINSKAYIHYIEDGDLDISTLSDFYGIYKEGKVTPVYGNRTTANYSGGIDSAHFKYNDTIITVKEDYNKSPSADEKVNIYPMSGSKITLTPGDNNITFYVKYKAGKDIYKMTGDKYTPAPSAATISSTFNKINGTYRIYTKSGDTYTLQPKPTKYKNTVELNLEKHDGYNNIKAGFAIHESLSIAGITRWENAFQSWLDVNDEYTKASYQHTTPDGYNYDVYEYNGPGNMDPCKIQITFK